MSGARFAAASIPAKATVAITARVDDVLERRAGEQVELIGDRPRSNTVTGPTTITAISSATPASAMHRQQPRRRAPVKPDVVRTAVSAITSPPVMISAAVSVKPDQIGVR